MLLAMREQPGNLAVASRVTGFDRKVCRKLWHEGRPSEPWGALPMKTIIDREQEAARAKRGENLAVEHAATNATVAALGPTPAEATAARNDAIETRTQEATMAKLGRGAALGLMSIALELTGAGRRLAKRVAESLGEENAKQLTTAQAMTLISRIVTMGGQAVATGNAVLAMERTLLGAPDGLSPGEDTDTADGMTEEEVEEELEAASALHERMKARRLRVLEGGVAAPIGEAGPAGDHIAPPSPAEQTLAQARGPGNPAAGEG